MIGLLLKKFFYDGWDNFFLIIAVNLGFILFLALAFILITISEITGILLFFLVIYWLFVYLCSAAAVLKEISDYRHPALADFFKNIKGAFFPAAVLFAASAFVLLVIRFTIPIYLHMETIAGLGAAIFSCWICLFIIASIQFYPAVYYRLGMHPLKSLKKCAAIFFDNTLFSFFTLFINIILTLLILPFPGCPLLFLDEALRLRLFKYDWLETHARKIKIPWNELLAEEKENTGSRSLKSLIFPWK